MDLQHAFSILGHCSSSFILLMDYFVNKLKRPSLLTYVYCTLWTTVFWPTHQLTNSPTEPWSYSWLVTVGKNAWKLEYHFRVFTSIVHFMLTSHQGQVLSFVTFLTCPSTWSSLVSYLTHSCVNLDLVNIPIQIIEQISATKLMKHQIVVWAHPNVKIMVLWYLIIDP